MKKIIFILSFIAALFYGKSNIGAMTAEAQTPNTSNILVALEPELNQKDEPEATVDNHKLTITQRVAFTLLVVGLVVSCGLSYVFFDENKRNGKSLKDSWARANEARQEKYAAECKVNSAEKRATDATRKLSEIEQKKNDLSRQLDTARRENTYTSNRLAQALIDAQQAQNRAYSLEDSLYQLKKTGALREALAALGFSPDQNPSPQEIKHRYFFMMTNFHPDKYRDDPNKSREAEAIAKQLNNAKSRL